MANQQIDIKKTLDWAQKNPNDPVAKSVIANYKKGLYNDKLKAAGMNPVPVKNLQSIPEAVEEVKKNKGIIAQGVDITKNILKDAPSDFIETGGAVIDNFMQTGRDIIDTAKRGDRTLAEKATMIGGRAFQGGADFAGELFIGAGKLGLTPQAEQRVSDIFQKAAQGVAQTQLAQDVADWYSDLDERDKDMVKAAGGFASVLAELVGARGATAASRVGREGLETVADTMRRGATDATKPPLTVVDEVVPPPPLPNADEIRYTGFSPEQFDTAFTRSFERGNNVLENRIVSAFDKGVKPNLGTQTTPGGAERYRNAVIQTGKTINQNKDNLQFKDPETGDLITGQNPQSLAQLRDALEQTKAAVFEQYDSLARQAGEAGLRVDVAPVANQLDEIINDDALRISNPEAVAYAQSVKDRLLQTGTIDAVTAQRVIQNYNSSLEAFYRNPTPEGLTRNAVDAYMVNNMRRALSEGIESITGERYQAIKNQYGALSTVERDVLRAALREARRNEAGLIDFTDIFTIGQLAGTLSNPAQAVSAGASYGLKRYYKYINDPNRQVKVMFDNVSQLPPDPEVPAVRQLALPPGNPDAPNASIYTPIQVGGADARGRIDVGVTERAREGAIKQPGGEPTPTVLEEAIQRDRDAVDQAMMEADAELSGALRPSVGDNLVQSADGGYYRFNELPSWIPKPLRDGNLMARVLRNINEGRQPRANAVNEKELQDLVQERINARVEELKNAEPTQSGGVFSGDTAFAAALMAGGTYFVMSEDGSMLPVVAPVALMANPVSRQATLKAAKRIAEQGGKLPESYKRQIADALEEYDLEPIVVRTGSNDNLVLSDSIEDRIAEIKAKNERGIFTDKDALEVEELMANKGVVITREESFNQGANPPTTLLEKAKKYESAEEFVKAHGEPVFHATDSDVFDPRDFNPKAATKGEEFFNPLGSGLYASSNKDFVRRFGSNTMELVLPKDAKIKNVSIDSWEKDFSAISRRALKNLGIKYNDLTFDEKLEINRLVPNTPIESSNNFEVILSDIAERLGKEGSVQDAIQKSVMEQYKNYDVIKYLDTDYAFDADEIVVKNPSILKTRTQLEDIWKQANATTTLLEEAKKYKTTQELYKDKDFLALKERAEQLKTTAKERKDGTVVEWRKLQNQIDDIENTVRENEEQFRKAAFKERDLEIRKNNPDVDVLDARATTLLHGEAKGKTLDEFIGLVRGSSTQYGAYKPQMRRFVSPQAKRLSEIEGIDPNQIVTIYRGIDDQTGRVSVRINPGDFVTTNYDEALAYTDSPGKVAELRVKAKTLIEEYPDEFDVDTFMDSASEFIYQPKDIVKITDTQLEDIWKQANE